MKIFASRYLLASFIAVLLRPAPLHAQVPTSPLTAGAVISGAEAIIQEPTNSGATWGGDLQR
jgi:hypothetical protein